MTQLEGDGPPIVRSETRDEMISIAWRRWQSFDRRHKPRSNDTDARVEDLAKGLCAAFEAEPKLVGPLMTDYRHTASILGAVFARDEQALA